MRSAETGHNPYAAYERTRFRKDPRRELVWREILRYLEKRLGVPRTMLDLGAGFCDAVNASNAIRRYAVDIRPEVASHAQAGVVVRVGSCSELDWLPEPCDWIVASNLFEHLPRETLQQTLRSVRASLTPGGVLIVVQPNFKFAFRNYFDDYTHLAEAIYTDVSLADVLEGAGLVIRLVRSRFLPFSMKERLPVHPLLVRAYLHSPWKPRAGQMLVVAGLA